MLRPVVLLLVLLAAATSRADPTLRIDLRTTKDQPVANAVVSLTPADGAPVPSAAGQVHQIVQQGQEFSPYVTAVPVGSTVVFPNRDTVQHHVYSLSKAKKFELPLYDPGRSERIVFDRPGVVTLGCNIHDWMLAYIVVVPSPWFAVSDESGRITISAPPGVYHLEVWQPRLSHPLQQDVTLPASGEIHFGLKLHPDRRIRRAPDSAGGGYN